MNEQWMDVKDIYMPLRSFPARLHSLSSPNRCPPPSATPACLPRTRARPDGKSCPCSRQPSVLYTRLESIPKPKTAYPAPNTPNPPVVVLVGAAVAGLRLLALFLLGHHECLLALVIHNVRGGVAARHKVTGFGFRVPGFGVSSYKMSAGTQPLYRLTCCRWWLELLARRVCLAYLKVQTRNPRARALSPRRTCARARAHTHTHTLSRSPLISPPFLLPLYHLPEMPLSG